MNNLVLNSNNTLCIPCPDGLYTDDNLNCMDCGVETQTSEDGVECFEVRQYSSSTLPFPLPHMLEPLPFSLLLSPTASNATLLAHLNR